MRPRFVLVLVLAALSGCGSEGGDGAGSGRSGGEVIDVEGTGLDAELVYRYCAYGSVSRAQLDGCVDHVEPGEILDRRTNAALYARYSMTDCRYDAGPFCKEGYEIPIETYYD